GLEDVDDGAIFIGDSNVTDLAPRDRDIAMVFQNYALYPHMSVADNMGFALKIAGVSKEERRRRVADAAALLDLEPYLDRKPKALSGGQRQRVAMGRAIVREPQVFLMDEPLSNLDAKLRVQTRTQIAALQRRLGITTVYVTHDQVEAMTMGDRVAVMRDGLLQQCATPRELYDRPANVFVAGFIGSPAMNLRDFQVENGHADVGGSKVALHRGTIAALADEGATTATLGFRPESLEIVRDGEGFGLTVNLIEELGSDAYVYGTLDGCDRRLGDVDVIARVDSRRLPAKGDRINLRVRPGETHVFSTQTGQRLSA
ncbi:MAG: ATP-binding cassette domain-containing protein, partial [Propionibacteriales bacterium]|nr:ATP-binding cassette domain-containing protein [Propionibacteriales bacterium]